MSLTNRQKFFGTLDEDSNVSNVLRKLTTLINSLQTMSANMTNAEQKKVNEQACEVLKICMESISMTPEDKKVVNEHDNGPSSFSKF